MMSVLSRSRVSIMVIILLESVNSGVTLPQCQDKSIVFTEEPADVQVGCGSDGVAVFPCRYEGTSALPQWIINYTIYSSLNSQLPPDHFYSAHTLTVTNINPTQNYTAYQCQLVLSMQAGCAHQSNIGRLITTCDVLDVQCLPHYLKTSEGYILKSIQTTVSQVENYESFYTMKYSVNSSKICAFITVSASSCVDGACTRTMDLLMESLCPNTSDVNVSVSIFNSFAYGYFPTSETIRVDAVNNFIEVTFDDVAATINLRFINQPTETEKFYTVKYGPTNPGCMDLPLQMKGHLTNSNYISIELNVPKDSRSKICFSAVVSNSVKKINVEGTHLFVPSKVRITATVTALITTVIVITVLAVCLCLLPVCILTSFYCHYRHTKLMRRNQHLEFLEQPSFEVAEKGNNMCKIDLSTTFFKLSTIPCDRLMSEFASNHDPPFEPLDGFGYYKVDLEKMEDVKPHKSVIMMEQLQNKDLVPRWTAKKATIQGRSDISARDIYIQVKSSNRILLKGHSFLYCAHSKVITAYWKTFPVTEECRESKFLKKIISGYQSELIRYGYFEFTKQECVKPNQRVIVMKKDDTLVIGPGVRHLMKLIGDGSTETQPPNLEEHNEWKHVFVQSDGSDRMLAQDTEYLFCAPMDRVDAHYSVYEVPEHCDDTVFSFGRNRIPGFKSESGYGYFEFTQPEYLKPYKNVILMDKGGKLFTGAGARFFYTGLKYDQDEILRRRKISPPSLDGTEWKHIFLQSHSKTRKLCPQTMFLYCEYKTLTPHLN